jgi:hypothetical protein
VSIKGIYHDERKGCSALNNVKIISPLQVLKLTAGGKGLDGIWLLCSSLDGTLKII